MANLFNSEYPYLKSDIVPLLYVCKANIFHNTFSPFWNTAEVITSLFKKQFPHILTKGHKNIATVALFVKNRNHADIHVQGKSRNYNHCI